MKNILVKKQIVIGETMGADVISPAVNTQYLDDIGFQCNFDAVGSPVGSFVIQGSIDHTEDVSGNIVVAGNWFQVSSTAALSAGPQGIGVTSAPWPWMRLKYSRTSGTNSLNAFICGKSLS